MLFCGKRTRAKMPPGCDLYIDAMPALSIGGYGSTRQEAMDKIEEAAEVTIEGLRETGQPVPQSLLDGGFRGATLRRAQASGGGSTGRDERSEALANGWDPLAVSPSVSPWRSL